MKKLSNEETTNDCHSKIISLATKIIELSEFGINDNLDPACLSLFKKAKDEAFLIKQRSKAEIEKHASEKK